jgi:hypothetical protein
MNPQLHTGDVAAVAGTTAIKKDRFETDSGDGDFLNFCRPKMGRVSAEHRF